MTTVEDILTSREIKLIAFESKGVDTFNPNFMEELSYRVQGFIYKAMFNTNAGYIVRRCIELSK